jgi:hypothetical protein
MKVWIDLISGDEMVSDSYPHTEVYDGAGLEVRAKYTTKGSDFIAIASDDVNEDDGASGETVVDIVDAFGYNELPGFAKKDFMLWCKGYLAKVTAKLTEIGKADRVDGFKKGATEMVKFIVSRYDEMQVFAGKKYEMEAGLCVAYQKNQEDAGPTFLFFLDGMKEEKF